MSHYAKRKLTRTARPAYRTQGWALGVLVEQQAVKQADAAGEYAKRQIDVLQGHLQAAKSLKSTKTSNR
jgi:hypothetical protein